MAADSLACLISCVCVLDIRQVENVDAVEFNIEVLLHMGATDQLELPFHGVAQSK